MAALEITIEQLAASPWLDMVDIRPNEERELVGFIPGSFRVDIDQFLVDRDWGTGSAVLVCTGGHRTQVIAENWPGSTHMTLGWLRGGVLRWREAGLPVVTDDVEPGVYTAGDATSPAAVVGVLRSCFVAEMVEGAMQIDDGIDPIEVFEEALQRAGVTAEPQGADDIDRVIDHLAACHRRLGGSMARIAENVGAMRALTQYLRARTRGQLSG